MVKIKILHSAAIQTNLLTFFIINKILKIKFTFQCSQIKHYILNKIEIFKYFYLINITTIIMN